MKERRSCALGSGAHLAELSTANVSSRDSVHLRLHNIVLKVEFPHSAARILQPRRRYAAVDAGYQQYATLLRHALFHLPERLYRENATLHIYT